MSIKTSNRIFKVVRRMKASVEEFEVVITHAELTEDGHYYVSYKPVGGRDLAKCGSFGTALVNASGNPVNCKTRQPSEWGCSFTRTDRDYVAPTRRQPRPGDPHYDPMC